MPYEIIFDSEAELKQKLNELKKKGVKIEECIIKINKDNVKFKLRSKRTLYTAVLTPEKMGVGKEDLKNKAEELASLIECPEPKVIE